MVRTTRFAHTACPPELDLLDAISGKWTILAVYILSEGTLRSSELQRVIGGISQKVLTQTLRNLERHGVVKRTVYPVVPPQVEYSLTKLGRSLVGVLAGVCVWSKDHYEDVAAARTRFDASKGVPPRD